MESKDQAEYLPASRPAPLQLDPVKFDSASDAEDTPILSAQGTPTPSTSSSSTAFPPTAGRPRSMTQAASVPPPPHGRNRSATVANPPKSAPPGGAPPEREKRKRSRVTPEQLAHLERLFAMDRSPTAAKRKEISEMLGMQERQTQIWFQNRRAKAKTLEGKGKSGFRGSPTSGADSPPGTPSDFNPALEGDLQSLVQEVDPVTFIPCSDLTIGTWRRIASSPGQHDLLAYISPVKRSITWFIHAGGYGFKMEIPFDYVANSRFSSAPTQGQGLASLFLSRPPIFYMETITSPSPGAAPTRIWKGCADWTEGHQASQVLRHDLVGVAGPLIAALKMIKAPERTGTGSAIHAPYHSPDSMPPTMHIPQPPLAGLDPPSYPLAAGSHSHLIHGRKRSFSGPPAMSHHSQDASTFALLASAAPASQYSTSFSERPSPLGFGNTDFSASMLFRQFPNIQQPQPAHSQSSSLTDFSTVPISHAAASRSYSGAGEPQFSFDPTTTALFHDSAEDRFSPSDSRTNRFDASSSSPLLLTSAFDPSTLRHHNVQESSTDAAMDTSGGYGGNADVAQPPDGQS